MVMFLLLRTHLGYYLCIASYHKIVFTVCAYVSILSTFKFCVCVFSNVHHD